MYIYHYIQYVTLPPDGYNNTSFPAIYYNIDYTKSQKHHQSKLTQTPKKYYIYISAFEYYFSFNLVNVVVYNPCVLRILENIPPRPSMYMRINISSVGVNKVLNTTFINIFPPLTLSITAA